MSFPKSAAAFLLISLSTPTAFADDVNARVGAFVDASVGTSGIGFSNTGLAESGDAEFNGTSATVRGGYWLNRNWGVSAYYSDLGEFEQKFVNAGRLKADGESYGVSIMGRLPLAERWALVGKVNVNRASLSDNGSTLSTANLKKLTGEKTSAVLPGVELHYALSEQTTVFVEVDPRGAISDKVDVGYAGIGLRVGF